MKRVASGEPIISRTYNTLLIFTPLVVSEIVSN